MPTNLNSTTPRSTASVAGHPIHPMLVPIPIACFLGTLVTDISYAETAQMQWTNFSAWLLVVGIVFTVLAAIAGVIDLLGEARVRSLPAAWVHALGNVTVLILAILNSFVHTHDAYTSVVPTGLALSVITVLILLVTGWLGGELVYRHRVGMRPEDRP